MLGLDFNDPLVPDPDTARDLLKEELARSEYNPEPNLVVRLVHYIREAFSELFSFDTGEFSLRSALIIGFVIVLVILFSLILANPIRLRNRRVHSVMDEEDVTLLQAQQRLNDAVNHEDWSLAVVWAFRCSALVMDQDNLLRVSPGLTAQEVSGAAQRQFPDVLHVFDTAADIFDDVRYGDRMADRNDFEHAALMLRVVEQKGRR